MSIEPESAASFAIWSGVPSERAELEFILRMLQPGVTFLDIGANIGIFSLMAGRKLCGKASTICAFEPCRSTFSLLERNLSRNHLTNVRAIRAALSDEIGEAYVSVHTPLSDALHSLEAPIHADEEVAGREPARMTTLDEFVRKEHMPRVDVIKVDAEGAELRVLKGARKLLERTDAPLILYGGYSRCTAHFHYHPVEIMWLLEEYGYELFVLDPESRLVRRRTPGETYDAKIVAVKPAHPHYADVLHRGRNG
ncbi:MAG: FkbM family methyltransferase [Candidatus Acidiferrales bacterium]